MDANPTQARETSQQQNSLPQLLLRIIPPSYLIPSSHGQRTETIFDSLNGSFHFIFHSGLNNLERKFYLFKTSEHTHGLIS